MREDNRKRQAEKSAQELLDAAISNYRHVDPSDGLPREGLEDRVLANLRQQSRISRSVGWNRTSLMVALAVAMTLFAVDHLIYRLSASVPSGAAVSGNGESRGVVDSKLTARHVKAEERGVMADVVGQAKAFAASKRTSSSSRKRDLALNLNSRPGDERAGGGLRIEEVRITEVRLDDIVIGGNERQE